MTTLFHINTETGDTGPCTAKKSCPFGAANEHYDSLEEAASAAERTLTDQYGGTAAVGKKKSADPNVPAEYAKAFNELAQNDFAAVRSEVMFEKHRREGKEIKIDSAEFGAHSAFVERKVGQLVKKKMTTDEFFSDADGIYTEERMKQHEEIVDAVLSHYENVPNESKALISGGTGGAGKGYILKTKAGVSGDQTDQYVVLNPDDIKEMMAEREMIPSVRGLTPMEASPLAHEEARHITDQIERRALKQKKNVLHDMTAKSIDSAKERLDALDEAGYQSIDMVFVDVDLETTSLNAEQRHLSGLNEMLVKGKGHGGRFLPAAVNEKSRMSGDYDSTHNSKNAENVQALLDKGYVDSLTVWDNNRANEVGVDGVRKRKMKEPEQLSTHEFKSRSSKEYQANIWGIEVLGKKNLPNGEGSLPESKRTQRKIAARKARQQEKLEQQRGIGPLGDMDLG